MKPRIVSIVVSGLAPSLPRGIWSGAAAGSKLTAVSFGQHCPVKVLAWHYFGAREYPTAFSLERRVFLELFALTQAARQFEQLRQVSPVVFLVIALLEFQVDRIDRIARLFLALLPVAGWRRRR